MELLPLLDFEVNTVLTSPPYFRKRKYGESPQEIGNEATPEDYVRKLVAVFNAIKLHRRGSLWVNLGDSRDQKTGNLLMVPERFALAMQEAGWILADNIIWAKVEALDDGTCEGHCMIEPAQNRLNGNGYEYLYRFVRGKLSDAWVDPWSIMIPRRGAPLVRYMPKELMRAESSTTGRCLQNVWRVQIELYRQKHYAPYPTVLCERPIAMTCPLNICQQCGHIRTRIVDKKVYLETRTGPRIFGKYTSDEKEALVVKTGRRDAGRGYTPKMPVTTGWTTCSCRDWGRGIVLDPFLGSGTTGEVALKMGRKFIGFDLYQANVDMSETRCQETLAFLKESKLDPLRLEQ